MESPPRRWRVAVVATGRADYGLLRPLVAALTRSSRLQTAFVATRTRLSVANGGIDRDFIARDGLPVSAMVDLWADGDDSHSVCHSVSKGVFGFSELFRGEPPDLLVVLGDRYELWAACVAAALHRIPIAHIHGGESTLGAIDEAVRHSVSKMASLHFASIEPYARRIVQMGEAPERVFTVGALGLDNVREMPSMGIRELSELSGLDFAARRVALLTYHPVTLDDPASAGKQAREILSALMETELVVLATSSNADAGGEAIRVELRKFRDSHPDRIRLSECLGQRGYLGAMSHAAVMVGNSSSGILEAASFRLPVVNVGDRQGGRLKPANVIDCACSEEAVRSALRKAVSAEFASSIADLANPYGDGHSAARIAGILESMDFSDKSVLLRKRFHDLNFP